MNILSIAMSFVLPLEYFSFIQLLFALLHHGFYWISTLVAHKIHMKLYSYIHNHQDGAFVDKQLSHSDYSLWKIWEKWKALGKTKYATESNNLAFSASKWMSFELLLLS